jgi:hypothetical protein
MNTSGRIAALAALLATASCVPKQEKPAPEPVAQRPAPPAPAPAPPAAPPPAPGWEDAALAPGDWTYRADSAGSEALYGAGTPLFSVRCEASSRRVALSRPGAGEIVVRTTSTERSLASAPLAANDPLLDAIVFSRGRFAVEASGQARLVIPSWPEPARVIEDCREGGVAPVSGAKRKD